MARDFFHHTVENALIKDGWIITHDPLFIKLENKKLTYDIDIGAEKIVSAEKIEKGLLKLNFIKKIVSLAGMRFIIFDPITEEIEKWID